MRNLVKSVLTASLLGIFIIFATSCEKDKGINDSRKCKVMMIKNINNPVQVGDTIFVEVTPGHLLSPPSVTRPGKVLYGWYTDINSAGGYNGNANPKYQPYDLANNPIWLDMIFYARWVNP